MAIGHSQHQETGSDQKQTFEADADVRACPGRRRWRCAGRCSGSRSSSRIGSRSCVRPCPWVRPASGVWSRSSGRPRRSRSPGRRRYRRRARRGRRPTQRTRRNRWRWRPLLTRRRCATGRDGCTGSSRGSRRLTTTLDDRNDGERRIDRGGEILRRGVEVDGADLEAGQVGSRQCIRDPLRLLGGELREQLRPRRSRLAHHHAGGEEGAVRWKLAHRQRLIALGRSRLLRLLRRRLGSRLDLLLDLVDVFRLAVAGALVTVTAAVTALVVAAVAAVMAAIVAAVAAVMAAIVAAVAAVVAALVMGVRGLVGVRGPVRIAGPRRGLGDPTKWRESTQTNKSDERHGTKSAQPAWLSPPPRQNRILARVELVHSLPPLF